VDRSDENKSNLYTQRSYMSSLAWKHHMYKRNNDYDDDDASQ